MTLLSKDLLNLAWRNLRRNRRRTLITASSVAFGVWLAAIFIGTRESTYERLINTGANGAFGHATFAKKGFIDLPSPSSRITFQDPRQILLSQVDGVAEALPRILINAVVGTSAKTTGAAILAVDFKEERTSHNIYLAALKEGNAPTFEDESGCLVGASMAEHLGLKIGNKIIFTTTDVTGQMTSNAIYVRGIFRTGSNELDGHALLMPLSGLQKTLGYLPGEASYLAIYGRKGLSPDQLFSQIMTKLEVIQTRPSSDTASYWRGTQLYSWRQSLADLSQYIQIDGATYRILIIFLGIIIAAGILNTMMISVLERRRELGIMMAVGMLPTQLLAMVVCEAGCIALFGFLIGLITLAPSYFYLHNYGIDLSYLLSDKLDAGGVAIDFKIGCLLTVVDIGMIALALIFMTMIAAAYPAWKAAWTTPIEVIRT